MISKEDRICYYLGDLAPFYKNPSLTPKPSYTVTVKHYRDIPEFIECPITYRMLKVSYHTDWRRLKKYCDELCTMLEQSGMSYKHPDQVIQIILGDNVTIPSHHSFSKTRPIDCTNITLLNLNYARHWKDIQTVLAHDISFAFKKNAVVWRGASNGRKRQCIRDTLVRAFQDHPRQDLFHIRYSELVEGYKGKESEYKLHTMKIQDQLKYKFIISIEGNDVATNLKWVMFSNSVVLMPPPRIVSWFMEDKLVPYVHYVPLKEDVSDLEEQYAWCMSHMTECEQIAKNGKEYVKQFLNKQREIEITNAVIQTYYQAVQFVSK